MDILKPIVSVGMALTILPLYGCKANEPVVNFDANGGTFAPECSSSADTVVTGGGSGDLARMVCVPVNAHYAFTGWYESPSADGDAITDLSALTSDTTLYAGWAPETYIVTFATDDNSAYSTETVIYGNAAEAPEAPTKDGYTFTGWYTDPACTALYDGSEIESDTTLYAGFEKAQTVWDLRELPDYTFVSQVKPSLVWMGCESAALLMALKTTGHAQDITYSEFLSALPMTDTDNPYLGFCGDLYSDTWMRDAVMPNIVAEWGAQYGNTRDLTKLGLDAVISAIENGHPVVVWTSVHMQPSETVWDDTQMGVTDDATDPLTGEVLNYHGSAGSHWEYKTHNHVMTLLGYNSETNEFLLGDPAEWLGETYWITYDTFMASWNCYQGAVEVW